MIFLPAYAEQIPDYDKPYSPIFTDKSVYSWTDKVKITILAPSWNSDRDLIDSIGDDEYNPIKISTGDHHLEPYRFTETGVNTGIFTAEVTLTGFSHDADGDGDIDTTPRTLGNGPTSGFLEAAEMRRPEIVLLKLHFFELHGIARHISGAFGQRNHLGDQHIVEPAILG